MTRAQGPDSEIEYRSTGSSTAERTVFVLRTGALAVLDPAPHVTSHVDARVVLVHLDVPELDDPAAYGGETPAESTVSALADLVGREAPGGPVAVVGQRATTAMALALAATLPDRVDAVAVVAPSMPPSPLERDLAKAQFARLDANVLLVVAASEPATLESADWCADAVPRAEVQHVDDADIDSPDGRLGLGDAWATVLAHLVKGNA